MTSVDQMQLGVISCLYIMEIMEMGKVSLLIMLPQNLDSLYICIYIYGVVTQTIRFFHLEKQKGV